MNATGFDKYNVMVQTTDGRVIDLGKCEIQGMPTNRKASPEGTERTSHTHTFSMTGTIENANGSLLQLLRGGTPRGRSIDLRKEKRTIFFKTDIYRMPRKMKKKVKKINPDTYDWWKRNWGKKHYHTQREVML